MLSKVIGFARSKWTLGAFLGAWVLSLAYIFDRGWIWESHEYASGNRSELWSDFFQIHRTRVFVWLTLILCSYGAYYLKKRSIRLFGCVEIGAGILGGYLDVATVPLNTVDAWLALVVAAYAVVSGAENIADQS